VGRRCDSPPVTVRLTTGPASGLLLAKDAPPVPAETLPVALQLLEPLLVSSGDFGRGFLSVASKVQNVKEG